MVTLCWSLLLINSWVVVANEIVRGSGNTDHIRIAGMQWLPPPSNNMPSRWSGNYLMLPNGNMAHAQIRQLLLFGYDAKDYIHFKQEYLKSIVPYLVALSRANNGDSVSAYLSVAETSGTVLQNAALTFRRELFEIVRLLEVEEPKLPSSPAQRATALEQLDLVERCAYFFDASQDFTTRRDVDKFQEALHIVVAQGLDCLLVNSLKPPRDARTGEWRRDTNRTEMWVRMHTTNSAIFGNRDQLAFAIRAPLLITRQLTTWADFPLMKRAQLGRPSVIMNPVYGQGLKRLQPPLSAHLQGPVAQTSIAPHLLCNVTDGGSMPCTRCVFVRGVCIEGDLWRGEEWATEKCDAFKVGVQCLGIDARDKDTAWCANADKNRMSARKAMWASQNLTVPW